MHHLDKERLGVNLQAALLRDTDAFAGEDRAEEIGRVE
jgi:hypothetical protein